MDNLARIISHGFAVVVVILLGIGFIYRGELFPDLELPDFLVPESAKTAGTGVHPETKQAELGTAREAPGGAQGEAMPSTPMPAREEATETAARETGAGLAAPQAAAPAGEAGEGAGVKAVPPVAVGAATVAASGAGSPQASLEESQPLVAGQPQVPAEGARAQEGEATGGPVPGSASPPIPSEETAGQPAVEAAAPVAGMQAGAVPQEPSPEPSQKPVQESGIPLQVEPPGAAPTSGVGEVPPPSEAPPEEEEAAPGTGVPVPESAPAVPPGIQPAVGGAAHGEGKSTAQTKPYELLAAAREAFWLHNYDDAEKNYRALTELEPNNPDGYGELGNMYFSQGRWDEAAAAYFEAGTRLVGEGRLDSARELVNVIRGLNGKQADDLEKLISSAASNGNN
jgi:hypothetical protein